MKHGALLLWVGTLAFGCAPVAEPPEHRPEAGRAGLVAPPPPLEPYLVRDIGYPRPLVVAGGQLYFTAFSFGARGGADGLWRTDGSVMRTYQVRGELSIQSNAMVAGSRIFLVATIQGWGAEPWFADTSTIDFPVPLKDVRPGETSSNPVFLGVMGSTVFFAANDGANGQELWRSDGTLPGTVLVADLYPGGSSNPSGFASSGPTRAYFTAEDGTHGRELWRTDGTAAGTARVADLEPGPTGSSPASLTLSGGTLFFTATRSDTGEELWRTDGTSEGTRLVADLVQGPAGSAPRSLLDVDGTLYFVAGDGARGVELWKSDGTEAGTARVKDIRVDGSSHPSSLVANNGVLYFVADDGTSGTELWRSDGTEAGTTRVKDITPGPTGTAIRGALAANGRLFFSADDGVHGAELWTSDGTSAGTRLVRDFNPGPSSSSPSSLVTLNRKLLFVTEGGSHGHQLWAMCLEDCGYTLLSVTCPDGERHEATTLGGAKLAPFPPPTVKADDSVSWYVTHRLPQDLFFPLGQTLNVITVVDSAGNRAECSFPVTVVDTTPPNLECPPAVHAVADGPEGTARVRFQASATDLASTPRVVYQPPSDSSYPVGTTVVTATARDPSGNSSSCAFGVHVARGEAPRAPGCGCGTTGASAGFSALCLLLAHARGRRRR
ncbi:MAG TPA: ELWxxDGT repeat protein [Myxococcaceae bacterium]|nr:ELWxxDGT repeat protein [Myxococcaceae bacterium]